MSVFRIYPQELFCIVMAFSYLCGNNLPIILLSISVPIIITILPGLILHVYNGPLHPSDHLQLQYPLQDYTISYAMVIALVYDLAHICIT